LKLREIDFPIEEYEVEVVDKIRHEIKDISQMTEAERNFLNGLLSYYKPRKIVEIGVWGGGGTAIILNAIKDNNAAKLYSVDYATCYRYGFNDKKIAWKAEELFNDCHQWVLMSGVDISEVINEIGDDIDFIILDTVHLHPAETLSFLSIFPYLKQNAIVVLHDVNQSFYYRGSHYANSLLFNVVTADKCTLSSYLTVDYVHPNIGAFQINDDTGKYIEDVFRSLYFPWEFREPERIIKATEAIINTKYSERLQKVFLMATLQNDDFVKGSRAICRDVQSSSGWSWPVAWGVWNDGLSAEIVLEHPQTTKGVRINFLARFFVAPPELPTQRVEIYVNDNYIESIRGDSMIASWKNVLISNKNLQKDSMKIRFEFPDAISPVELGMNDYDNRKLAMGLCAIHISENF
jgi:predicted O-methyltransferase YrrM